MVGRYWRCVGFETALVVTCAEPVEVGGDKVESVRIKLILQLSFVQAVENCSDRQAVHQLHMQQAYQATPRSSICSWTLFTWRMRARTILRLACSPSGRSATDFSQNPERSLVNLKPMPCQCNAMQCHAMPCSAMPCNKTLLHKRVKSTSRQCTCNTQSFMAVQYGVPCAARLHGRHNILNV